MAEDSDLEKTEPASPRRIEQAREEGDVPRSRELATCTILLAAGGGLWFFGGGLVQRLNQGLVSGLGFDRAQAFDANVLLTQIGANAIDVLLAFAPIAGFADDRRAGVAAADRRLAVFGQGLAAEIRQAESAQGLEQHGLEQRRGRTGQGDCQNHPGRHHFLAGDSPSARHHARAGRRVGQGRHAAPGAPAGRRLHRHRRRAGADRADRRPVPDVALRQQAEDDAPGSEPGIQGIRRQSRRSRPRSASCSARWRGAA